MQLILISLALDSSFTASDSPDGNFESTYDIVPDIVKSANTKALAISKVLLLSESSGSHLTICFQLGK